MLSHHMLHQFIYFDVAYSHITAKFWEMLIADLMISDVNWWCVIIKTSDCQRCIEISITEFIKILVNFLNFLVH